MITRENLKHCFDSLNEDEVNKALSSDKDYILFELHIFNVGGYATATPQDYDEVVAEEAQASGNVFVDKDEFLAMFEESGSDNPHLKEYV